MDKHHCLRFVSKVTQKNNHKVTPTLSSLMIETLEQASYLKCHYKEGI